jgi:hypothetical protein
VDLNGVLNQANALHTQQSFFSTAQGGGADFLLTVKTNKRNLYRQITNQLLGRRRIPVAALDQELSHGRDITGTLRANKFPS